MFHHFLVVVITNKNFVLIVGIMFYIAKIGDYLKILTDNEVKDFAVINFSGCFKSMREKLYSKLSEKQHLRKVVKSLYI